MTRRSDRAWERFGGTCPYYGVLSDDRFHGATLDGEARAEFFDSGRRHVEEVFSTIRKHLSAGFAPRRGLDFGCGVGRIAIPFAATVQEVVGLDVSESMLREARRNAELAGVENLTLLRSDDDLSTVAGEFDFIHSYIVFQHIPPARGQRIFAHLLKRLAAGGVGVVHFTFAKRLPGWRRATQYLARSIPLFYGITNLLRGRAFSYPLMQMNSYDLNRIFRALHASGCHRTFVRFSDHAGYQGVVLYFLKESLPSH